MSLPPIYSYHFGPIVIDGHTYRQEVIILSSPGQGQPT